MYDKVWRGKKLYYTDGYKKINDYQNSFKKHIILPVLRIVDDIIPDPLIRFIVADDMIVETGLPGETWYYFACIDGTDTFVLINDNAQCTRFPFRVFPAGVIRELPGFFIFGIFMN